MNQGQPKNISHSVRQRLKNLSEEMEEEFQRVLIRYAIERLLYRLTQSDYIGDFVLKGAMLFCYWNQKLHRATKDLDLLGTGESSVDQLEEIFRTICGVDVVDDGLRFNKDKVRGVEIREDQEYEGVKILMGAALDSARIPLQIDIGFGDVIVPSPQLVEYPTILEFPSPHLKAYPRETTIAEKYQTIVRFGIASSRVKDFYDIWFLAQKFTFDGQKLSGAIGATFKRRRTTIPLEIPVALSADFFNNKNKQAQWRAFIEKGRLEISVPDLRKVSSFLEQFLIPPALAAATRENFTFTWSPPGPWQ